MLRPLMVNGAPHWTYRFPEEVWPAFTDFRNMLCLVWEFLGLPDPTRAQLEIAHRLQYGVDTYEYACLKPPEVSDAVFKDRLMYESGPREDVIRVFRAGGKSYITSSYVAWRTARNPRDEKSLVLSATDAKARQFVHQTKNIIIGVPLLSWLLGGSIEGGGTRRDKADEFDVQYASLSQSASVTAKGIDGQITGSRATLIVPDDVEIRRNSKTEDARSELLHRIRTDIGPIRKTEHGVGDAIFLGTPHSEESLYNVLVREMGYRCFCIPIRYPTADKREGYILRHKEGGGKTDILAPYLRHLHEERELVTGEVTDTRYTEEECIRLESQGRREFIMQYMLDTSLSDSERYPLRQHDLMVMSLHPEKAPITVQWGRCTDSTNLIKDIPNIGFSGDYLMRPLFIDKEWRRYEGKVLYVDPSGRGADETAWAIVAQLSGTLFVLHVGAYSGDPAEAMVRIAKDAARFGVDLVEVEPNYGQGMFVAALVPILARIFTEHGIKRAVKEGFKLRAKELANDPMSSCGVQEGEWSKGQKEVRIITGLEPVMTTHRLVIDEEVVKADVRSAVGDDESYSLMYQLTHITLERGSLKHDDRIEAVWGGCMHFMRALEIVSEEASKAILDDEKQKQIDQFVADYQSGFPLKRPARGLRRKYKDRDYSDYEPDELVVTYF